MNYIKKMPIPIDFINDTNNLTNWEDYSDKKSTFYYNYKQLHKYLLKEQENLCLDPISLIAISDYFIFDKDTGEIKANESLSEIQVSQANYMIELLNLNYIYLSKARLNSIPALMSAISQTNTHIIKNKALLIKKLLSNKLPYITFLRYYYIKNL